MVRLSDIFQTGHTPLRPEGSPPKPAPQSPPPQTDPPTLARAPESSAPLHHQPAGPGGVGASRALYAELLQESERCMAQARDEQRVMLAELPVLTEQLVHQLLTDDRELLRLSISGGGQDYSAVANEVNVAVLAARVGIALDYPKEQLERLVLACLIHDIGMAKLGHLVTIRARLGAEQLSQVREHPVRGYWLLQRCPDLPPLIPEIILQEHERHDGSGYPHRLAGPEIRDHAQLIGLLDLYEALTHDRPYRVKFLPAEAMRTIVRDYQASFRKEFLQAFLKSVPVYPVDSWVKLNTGEQAKVVATHRESPLSPTVDILVGQAGKPRTPPATVDLTQEAHLCVTAACHEPVLQA